MRRSEAVRLIMLVDVEGLRAGQVLTDGLWSDIDEALRTLLPERLEVIELIQQVYRTAGLLGIDHGEAGDWENMLTPDPPVEEPERSIDPGFGKSIEECMRIPNTPALIDGVDPRLGSGELLIRSPAGGPSGLFRITKDGDLRRKRRRRDTETIP